MFGLVEADASDLVRTGEDQNLENMTNQKPDHKEIWAPLGDTIRKLRDKQHCIPIKNIVVVAQVVEQWHSVWTGWV